MSIVNGELIMVNESPHYPFTLIQSSLQRDIGVKEMGNSRFLCENAVFQRTTPHHVILTYYDFVKG